MELNVGLSLLLKGLPAIVELITAIQNERILHLKQHAKVQNKSAKATQDFQTKRAITDRETQLQLAAYQRETSLQLLERQTVLEQWSLGLFPAQLLDTSSHADLIPLQIFLVPPTVQLTATDQSIQGLQTLGSLLAQGLADFLNQHYPLHSPERPTELLSGAWRDHALQREARIKALFHQLRDRPTLVLETDIVGESLNIRLAYWGLTQSQYCYRTVVADLPWRNVVYASMKRRALQWKATAQQLLALGESPETILPLGGDNVHNLKWLEKEAHWQAHAIATNTLRLPYTVSPEDFTELHQTLIQIYCVLAGWLADAHHLLNANVSPRLPGLMAELTDSIALPALSQSLLGSMISGYQELFHVLKKEMPDAAAQFMLQLAYSLSQLPDRTWSKSQLTDSLNFWLSQRQLPPVQEATWSTLSSVLKPTVLKPENQPYLQTLKACFAALGENESVQYVDSLLNALSRSKELSCLPAVKSTAKQNKRTSAKRSGASLQLVASPQIATPSIALTRTLGGYSGKAASLAFCNNGQILVSAREDHTIKLHHLESDETLQTFTGKAGRVLTLALSPDGQLLASSHQTSDRSSIKVWNVQTGKLLHTLTGHHKWIYALAISPDNRFLVSGGHKIKIWDLQTGKLLQTLAGHKDWVYCLAVSPNGQTIISAGTDRTIKLWHLPTGKLLDTLGGHLDWIRAIALSSDGHILASGSDDNTIRLWDIERGTIINTLTGHLGGVSSVVLSPDQETLFSGSKDNTIRLWQVKNGALLNTLTNHKKHVYSLAMSPDGKTFASGSEDKTILVWQRTESA